MSVADYNYMLPGQFGEHLHRGHLILQETRLDCVPFTKRRETIGAGRVRAAPGAGGINDRLSEYPLLTTVCVSDVNNEGLFRTPRINRKTAPLAPYTYDACTISNPVTKCSRERGEIALDPLSSRRITRLRCRPPSGIEQADCCGISQLRPLRKKSHMTPLSDSRGRATTRFEDDRLQPSLQQVSGRCQPLRASSDYDDGIHQDLHALTFFDMTSLINTSTDVNT